MPPHKWVDNAELSAPDQMTNITEKTRPQSYLQLSERRPSTQDQFKTLGFTVCISVCVRVCVRVWLLNAAQAHKTMQTDHKQQQHTYLFGTEQVDNSHSQQITPPYYRMRNLVGRFLSYSYKCKSKTILQRWPFFFNIKSCNPKCLHRTEVM